METAKQEVQQILNSLPETASFEEIQYRIYVHQTIAAGLRDLDSGQVLPHEEVVRRMAKWTDK